MGQGGPSEALRPHVQDANHFSLMRVEGPFEAGEEGLEEAHHEKVILRPSVRMHGVLMI